jgi:hypothetical protein
MEKCCLYKAWSHKEITNPRSGEIKFGEKCTVPKDVDMIIFDTCDAQYVIVESWR